MRDPGNEVGGSRALKGSYCSSRKQVNEYSILFFYHCFSQKYVVIYMFVITLPITLLSVPSGRSTPSVRSAPSAPSVINKAVVSNFSSVVWTGACFTCERNYIPFIN